MSLPPVECLYVTTDCIRQWKEGNSTFKVPRKVPVLRFLYELCWIVVRGELPFQKCKAALDSAEFLDESSPDESISSNLADIIAQMCQDLTLPGDYRSRLIRLAKWLVESALVPVRLFQERCEEEFLWESEMIKIKAADLKSKEVRVNTRLLYQQTKFNLLREESEGYAKLVTLLSQGSDASSQVTPTATVGIIKSLIGHFDLDPNRVFDIVLECFELQTHNSIFFDLIPIFPKSHASQILGSKFQYYQRMEVNQTAPFSLYRLTALLVKRDFIDLDSIYVHLLPKDEEAFEHYIAFSSKRLEEANKIGKINLAATGKDLMEEEKTGDVTVDLYAALDIESEAVSAWSTELGNNQTLGLLTGFLSVDDWYHAHILFDRLSVLNPAEHHQICDEMFRLIQKSLSPAYDLVRKTSGSNSGLPLGSDCDLMETNSLVHSPFIDVPKELFEMLASVGPYLYRNTLLLQKVCRVLKGYYLSAVELVRANDRASTSGACVAGNINPRLHLKEARLRIEDALGSCLLPSLQLVPANPAVGQVIWEVMNLLPYEGRYRLYGEWEKDDEQIPMILVARQTAKLDTRRILKRLAKENLKQLGRMVAKLAHASPMTVLRTIVNQIEAYRDMITPVVDAFKYLTQLEYDILEYVVIERLAQSGRDKLKDDGINLSDWLQSLASFWGHLIHLSPPVLGFSIHFYFTISGSLSGLKVGDCIPEEDSFCNVIHWIVVCRVPLSICPRCKKYPSMELRGLFQYLVNQLKRGNGIELVLLQELIQQMANVQYTENMTEEQLDSMSGSDTLRYQATSFGMTRNNKALIKSTNRLRDSLLPKDGPKLAIPLLLLIAQHRAAVVLNADVSYIKMVSEQFDRCHGTLLQYVEFLWSAVTPSTAYAQLIPSLHDLIHLYHLDPEVAFLIYRPVMRLFKCQNSNVFWPLNDNEYTTALADKEAENIDSSGKLVLDLGHPLKPTKWADLLATVRTMLPSKAWNSLSPDLYATFWGLTLYDLYVPKSRYQSEIAKQRSALKALEELSDNSSSAIAKRKKDKEKIQESLDRLINEFHKHEDDVTSVRRRLALEKDKWLSSCLDTLKINMEFLQRCIFPRCTFSMPDAVYCAMFVHTLHSLGTPFFNTVNHIDVLICKTLQPMICCCTEYEVGRLGRFLYETLKIAYHWKSDENIYERECGNMPGFAVYYRFPNSQRVTYGQFIKVHWKWSQRITRLLIQCLESTEYMEIRNSLIMLTKISSVFPVTRKSGINIEKRVAKIRSDEREDLKVLATGVAAALAARKPSWVSEEEFGMGYLELKPAASSLAPKPLSDGKLERAESASLKYEVGHVKLKAGSLPNGLDSQPSVLPASKALENQKQPDEMTHRPLEENSAKPGLKAPIDSEGRASAKRSLPSGSLSKQPRQDAAKDDSKIGKQGGLSNNISSASSANGNSVPASLKSSNSASESSKGESVAAKPSAKDDNSAEASEIQKVLSSRTLLSPKHDGITVTVSKTNDKPQKRTSPAGELDRVNKRRRGETDTRDVEGEVRNSDRNRSTDKHHQVDSSDKDKAGERHGRDNRGDRLERHEKSRVDDIQMEKVRERSMERHGREHSLDRGFDRVVEKGKEERSSSRDDRGKSKGDERFHGQSLPPPPPLPPHVTPQSVVNRRAEEDVDRRLRHSQQQRLSPRHEERERRSEEDFRERKRDERETISVKVEDRDKEREREREREKGASVLKEEMDAASKRRKLKRELQHMPEPGEYSPAAQATTTTTPIAMGISSSYDGRERGGDRKPAAVSRPGYLEDNRKEAISKISRREAEQMQEREWDDEKRQRVEPPPKRRQHRK